jgi:soluble lytic murein transglycosylase-like protein
MSPILKTIPAAAIGLGLVFTWTLPLHAAQKVTLKNGFDLTCDHQDVLNGKVRLYTSKGEEDFLEVDPAEIASVENIPDPPVVAGSLQGIQAASSPADLHELMSEAGARHNLDVDLLASVVRAESGGHVRAVSRAGAQGLMQLMPQTANQLGVTDSFRADQNINGGTAYLDALLIKYHDNLALALAAYNAGPAAVDKYHGIPPYRETRLYVARVIREFNRRKEAEILARTAAAHAPVERPAE